MAIARFEPDYIFPDTGKWRNGKKFVEQIVNAALEDAIFGAESVGSDFIEGARNSDEHRVGFHPPFEPGFELRLAAEFVHEITIIIEDGAIADDVRRVARSIQFRGDLRVQNPELTFDRGGRVHRIRRLPRHFRDEFDVVVGFLQQRAGFVSQRGLADAVCADQCEFQWRAPRVPE